MPNYFFVYGTLITGEKRFNYPALVPLRESIREARVEGAELYDLGDFPGMVRVEDRKSYVYGEVQKFTSVDRALKILDRLEQYNPTDIKNSLFRREEVKAILDDGTEIMAWAYFYNQPLKNAKRIASGDWKKRK
jgi:gamma-glutamylcyclotransferase (GGCT)/AIG2-like uncharacterized protein YtfP